jgi:hypothetical protein
VGGKIVGHFHPNEASWSFVGGRLDFFNEMGVASTVFDQIDTAPNGLRLSGRFLLEDICVTLALETLTEDFEPAMPGTT